MNIGVSVCVADFLVVHFAEPIVCGDCAGVAEDKSAYRIRNGGVFLYSPVVDFKIVVHQLFIVKHSGSDVTHFFVQFSVQNICFGHVVVTCFYKNRFHAVLNCFDGNFVIFDFRLEFRRYFENEKVDNVRVILSSACVERFYYGVFDLRNVKIYLFAVSFYYCVHLILLPKWFFRVAVY